MSQQFLALNRGVQTPGLVTVGTAAPTADFYLQISTTNTPTKEDVVLALNVFRQYIVGNGLVAGETGIDLPVL